MSKVNKLVTAFCSLALLAVIFLPLWRIELSAPQYPEGLVMKIYANRLGGDVEVVNGLNHYIGMRTLHEKDFVEFQVLPYIFGLFALFGLLAIAVKRTWFWLVWVGLFIVFSIMAMVDFYRWEYNYGHNLDPTAPIQVPGMTYQPPLIGFKQLLNFGAYSIPDAGGWIFITVAVLMLLMIWYEFRMTRRQKILSSASVLTIPIVLAVLLSGCQQSPVALRPGQDACDFCKMTVTDARFGSEILTSHGKVFKFDDMHCLLSYMKANPAALSGGQVYLVDFMDAGRFIPAEKGFLYKSEAFRSPMGGNTVAFGSSEACQQMADSFPGQKLQWDEFKNTLP